MLCSLEGSCDRNNDDDMMAALLEVEWRLLSKDLLSLMLLCLLVGTIVLAFLPSVLDIVGVFFVGVSRWFLRFRSRAWAIAKAFPLRWSQAVRRVLRPVVRVRA